MRYEAVVVGSGPNGLTAAATIARTGRRVLVVEAADTIGGGTRTEELTLPGYHHDVCSAVHPIGRSSPAFEDLGLEAHGVEWLQPDLPLAHPLDGGRAALLRRSLDDTAAGLGADGPAWKALFGPLVRDWETLRHQVLGPVRVPRHPVRLGRFGRLAVRSARSLVDARFEGEAAKALFAGATGHSFLPLDHPFSAAFGLLFNLLGQAGGWPIARGGSAAISAALASVLTEHGGEIVTGWQVTSLRSLPPCELVLLDTTPNDALRIVGGRAPRRIRGQLGAFRHGPGVFKIDYALDSPVPWTNEEVARAGTVHVGGTVDEIHAAEATVAGGGHAERPLVLVAQPTQFDRSRAPEGGHIAWAYCHVPSGSTLDMTERIEAQLERFAPGFSDRVLARSVKGPRDLEETNRNLVGGDIAAGANDGLQLLARPRLALDPYLVAPGRPLVYLCSASTPPGGGVHGMCGYHAARLALLRLRSRGARDGPGC
jgi:phytoene dehydrogenase-like protein